jgi:hypothetical protein
MLPSAIGRLDGWGWDDTLVVVGAVCTVMLAAALIGALVPRHGGRVHHWQIAGRAPQWVAMCLSGLGAGMAFFLSAGGADGDLLQGPVGVALGVASGVSAVMMTVGWWVRRLHTWVVNGMLLSACVWGGIAGAQVDGGSVVSGWVALWLAILTLLAWLTEVSDDGGEAGGP